MVRPCWITTEGEIIHCPNPMDHTHRAFERFPDKFDAEEHVVKLGWIKVTGYHNPPNVFVERQPNQRQLDAMFSEFPDDYQILMDCIHSFLDGDRSIWNAPVFLK